jgi:hypothetical protein
MLSPNFPPFVPWEPNLSLPPPFYVPSSQFDCYIRRSRTIHIFILMYSFIWERGGGYPSVQRHISCIRSLFTSFPFSIYILNSGKLGRAGSPWMVQKKKEIFYILCCWALLHNARQPSLLFLSPVSVCATGFIIHMYMYIIHVHW